MKIEMGESLMLSWLKHIKNCQIATLNWKCSKEWNFYNKEEIQDLLQKINIKFSNDIFGKSKPEQIISQTELDALGFNIDGDIIKNIYTVDVAFHENGLHYNSDGKNNNLNKITAKFLRTALVLYSIFNTKTGNITFATPKVQPKDKNGLIERTKEIEDFMKSLGFDFKFSFICNEDFYEQIFIPIQQASKDESDTAELFMRCLQMINLFDNNTNKNNSLKHTIPNPKKSGTMDICKVADIVHETLIPLLQSDAVTPEEINNFLDETYSKNNLGINFALLSHNRFVNGRSRYYSGQIEINGQKYFICSEWYESCRRKVLTWIENHQ